MGARTGLLVYADGDMPELLRRVGAADLDRTVAMMRRLHPDREIERCGGSNLGDGVYPPEGTVCAASRPGVEVIGDQEVMLDAPSQLPEHLVAASTGRRLVLHAMHSVVDRLAFAVWEDGRLVRSLSLSPDSGIIENIGEPLPFELPYWAGDRPADIVPWPGEEEEPYALPFHPLDLGEDALRTLCGFIQEGLPGPTTSTRTPSSCTDSTCGTRTGRLPQSRKRSCAELWRTWIRRASTRWVLTAH